MGMGTVFAMFALNIYCELFVTYCVYVKSFIAVDLAVFISLFLGY